MFLMEGHKGGHGWVEKAGGEGGIFLRIIHPRYGQWKVLQKKLIKTNILPLKKRGGQIFFQFFSLVFVRIMKFDSDMAAKLYFFLCQNEKKKNWGGIFGGLFFFWRRDHGFLLYVQFYILHSYMCILTNFRTLLLLNGRDKIMMKRNN